MTQESIEEKIIQIEEEKKDHKRNRSKDLKQEKQPAILSQVNLGANFPTESEEEYGSKELTLPELSKPKITTK